MVEKEQRRFTRISFDAKIKVTKGTIVITGKARDLSLKGLFVICREKLPVGQNVEVDIELSGLKQFPKVSVEGHIVRITPEGMGIDFDSMDLDSFIALKEMIAYNLGNEDKLRKEFIRYLQKTLNNKS